MKNYKLCHSCIHYQLRIRRNSMYYVYYNEDPVCTKSSTPTIRNRQEHCPYYYTNNNIRKYKRK